MKVSDQQIPYLLIYRWISIARCRIDRALWVNRVEKLNLTEITTLRANSLNGI